MRKNKLLLLLALLMTAATGAWADETLLLTIESRDYKTFKSGSKTFDDKVTVTFSNSVQNDGDNWGWYANSSASLLTVAGINGYTITSCKFYVEINGDAMTGYTIKGESPSVYLNNLNVYTDNSQSVKIGKNGVTKIEVYEAAPAPAGYTVSLKDGVKDADKWTISPNPAEEGQTVTLTYNGRLKVKGVKATSDAAPAEASVPDGAINGKFSVSATKQVYFSKGNLQATYNTSWSWAFATNQWDYIGNAAGNTKVTESSPYISENATVDLFGWVGAACAWTGAAQYGISNEKAAAQYGNVEGEALKSDWGTLAITNGGNTANFGWRSLASGEWEYLFKTRTTPSGVRYAHATVNDVPGLVLLPDDWSADYYSLNNVNDAYDTAYTDNVISSSDWTSKLEAHGAVFLPAGGNRGGATVNDAGNRGNYWSSTPGTSSQSACYFYFGSGRFMGNTSNSTRNRGCSVRLVREVATSDAGAPAAGNIVDLSTLTADYEAQNGDVLTGETSSYEVTIADGATVTLDGVTINGSSYCIKCAGDATIILKDGSTNTLTNTGGDYPALSIGDANTTLTIQGSTGVLNVSSGMYCAGIGGGYSNTNSTCGNIRIEGGVINAKGGDAGAGIGTDAGDATCGDIIITGGTITAKGGDNAAGIGSGASDSGGSLAVCGDITIANTVTKVTATAGENAPHSIGKGSGGKASCGTVTIGGTKYWENNAAVNGGDTYLAQSPLIYDPAAPTGNSVDLSTLTADYEAQNGDVLTGTLGANVKISIADGATVTLDGVTISNGQIACSGNANIILMGANTVTAASEKAAIKIGGPGTTLTITGSGSLTAQGGLEAAGIGTDRNENGELSFGNIVINGGTVTATGGNEGAGIGTGLADGQYASASITCGDITINGGTVTAIGGLYGAGIGTGTTMSDGGSASITCGDITINGGTVTATGGDFGPGIGTGVFLKYGYETASNGCGAITIGAGVTSVTATKGSDSPNSIGKGYAYGGTQNFGTINIGGTVYATGVTASPFTYTPSN